MSNAVRVPLEWLDEPRLRRSALTLVHSAVRAGWLSSNPSLVERRTELMGRLQAIADDPKSRSRERLRVLRIFAEMAR